MSEFGERKTRHAGVGVGVPNARMKRRKEKRKSGGIEFPELDPPALPKVWLLWWGGVWTDALKGAPATHPARKICLRSKWRRAAARASSSGASTRSASGPWARIAVPVATSISASTSSVKPRAVYGGMRGSRAAEWRSTRRRRQNPCPSVEHGVPIRECKGAEVRRRRRTPASRTHIHPKGRQSCDGARLSEN